MTLARWLGRELASAALLIAVVAVPALYAVWFAAPGTRDRIVLMLINIVLVIGLQVFAGNSGILSFGHMAFAGLGAYSSSLLTLDPVLKVELSGLPSLIQDTQLPFLGGVAVAAALCGVLALVTSLPVLRLSGASAVMATFALLLIANVVFTGWTGVTQGAGGLYAIDRATSVAVAFAFAAVAIVLGRLFKDSGAGLQLRASRDDALAAESSGVRVERLRLGAWVLSSVLCGIGGALLAHRLTAISPSNFFLLPTFIMIAMLIVGGISSVTGSVVGVMLVTVVQELARPIEDSGFDIVGLRADRVTGLGQIAVVVMILATMYARPKGLCGPSEADDASRGLTSRARRKRRAFGGKPERSPNADPPIAESEAARRPPTT